MDSTTDTSLAMSACPPLEDIAAFLDGTLSKEEREQIVAHLADCETCYDVFAGAADFQMVSDAAAGLNESEGPPAVPKVAAFEPKRRMFRHPFARKTWWRVAATAAAALVVLSVGVGYIYRSLYIQPEMTVAALTEPVVDKTNLSQYLYPAATYRGNDGEGDLGSPSHSFMAGVFLVDLQLTVQANDVPAASDRLQRIGIEVQSFFQSDDLAKLYFQESSTLHNALQNNTRGHDVLLQIGSGLSARENELEERATFPEFTVFGEWAAAGRIAAKAQALEFFQDRDRRRFLPWILRAQKEHLDPAVIESLQETHRTWKDEDLQPADFLKMEKQLTRIIEHYERESEQFLQD